MKSNTRSNHDRFHHYRAFVPGISIAAILLSLGQIHSFANPLSYGTVNSTYTQDFDSLSSTNGSGPALTGPGPFDFDSAPLSTAAMTGWQMAKISGTGANAVYTVDSGASTAGGVHDYGIAGVDAVTDRALGSLTSGTVGSTFGLVLTNSTGSTLDQATITFDGEQWRFGGSPGIVDKLPFSYSVGATSVTTGTFTSFAALDFSDPITSGITGPLDGNVAANRTAGITATINALNWTDGSTLVIRWTDLDISGSDNGLAVDNFGFVATPEPASAALLLGGGALLALRRRR